MGIKGIYREIGPGQRVSLCKLAVQTLEDEGRPLRIAIDISIWQFQVQAARGGANPAIRTLFYRLARLLGHSIQPIFVFDGPNKPAFKRNRRSTTRGGATGDVVSNAAAKRMIRLFGFQSHDAPGEAEAECALLQKRGIVDAVLSEDVDTIMFGCTRTLRNWSAEGVRGTKTPTHVSMYDSAAIQEQQPGLDREGMVLVALMSGGDYIPEGVPGCGVKVACEAARGGFGRSLCKIKKSDSGALAEWKETLSAELRENKSGFFRVRHKALTIPDEFPSLEVLRYYTHPVVSQEATLERLESTFPSTSRLDVRGLREFVAETFDWTGKIGAIKFIRVLAPGLLVQRILETRSVDDINTRSMEHLVKGISKSRTHFSTDGTQELRVSFVPTSVVDIDLDQEPDEVPEEFGRSGLALNSDEELEELEVEGPGEAGNAKQGPKKTFDPTQPDLVWIPEVIIKQGAPKILREWHAKLEARAATAQRTSNTTRTRKDKTMDALAGAMDKFLTVTKKPSPILNTLAKPGFDPSGIENHLIPKIPDTASGQPSASARRSSKQNSTANARKPMARSNTTPQDIPPPLSRKAAASRPASTASSTNPWTIASSQSNRSSNRHFKRANTYSHAGDAIPASPSTAGSATHEQPIYISSSPSDASPHPHAPLSDEERRSMSKKHPRRSPVPNDSDKIDSFSSDSFSALGPSPPKHRSPVAKQGRRGRGLGQRQTSPSPTARITGTKSSARPGKQASILSSVDSVEAEKESRAQPVAKSRQGQQSRVPPSDGEDEPKPRRPRFINPYAIVDLSDDQEEDLQDSPLPIARLEKPPGRRRSRTRDDEATGKGAAAVAALSVSRISTAYEDGEDGFVEKSAANVATTSKTATTKLYIPRNSAVGFVREVEVTREEADRLMSAQSSKGGGGSGGARSRMFRRSDITFVDLTAPSP